MAKEQLLVIAPPAEINFRGPYNRVVTEQLTLTNPTDSHIAFKVKTTAPKRYCVRPNNGIIAPKKQVTVSVMLQPQNKEEILNEKHKHKFMIQSVISPTETGTVEDIFKQSSPSEIMDSKFRCVFEDIGAEEKAKSPEFNQALSRVDITESVIKPSANQDNASEPGPKDRTSPSGQPDYNKTTTANSSTVGAIDDIKLKELSEENKKLKAQLLEEQSLRTKVSSPGSSGRITGAIPVVAQQQQQPQAAFSLILIICVAIIALIAGFFMGMNRH